MRIERVPAVHIWPARAKILTTIRLFKPRPHTAYKNFDPWTNVVDDKIQSKDLCGAAWSCRVE